MKLAHGSHRGKDGGCLMEIASLLLVHKIVRSGVLEPDWMCAEKTDNPTCLCTAISAVVQTVNDATPTGELWRLAPLLPRLLRARRAADQAVEDRIWLRLAIWAARYVSDDVDNRQRERADAALERAEKRLWEATYNGLDLYERDGWEAQQLWEPGWNDAIQTAMAAAGHHPEHITALIAAARCADNPALYLSDLLDAHEKALVEEGQLLWDPDDEYPDDDDINAVVEAILSAGRSNIGNPDIVDS